MRDYSAVDAQVEQIVERERILTNKLKLANKASANSSCWWVARGWRFFTAGRIAYRIAFSSKPEVIEKLKL